MKTHRKFTYVAFWSEATWVAGVTSYNNVAQGQTLARAIENLKHQLTIDAHESVLAGEQPFDGVKYPTMKEFASTEYASGIPHKGDARRDRRYRGEITAVWETVPKRVDDVPWYLQD